MFVNISPADYNCDETANSLVYATRVKSITNEAQKNSENKRVAELTSLLRRYKDLATANGLALESAETTAAEASA